MMRFIIAFALIIFASSCKKFIAIEPPKTDLVRSTVFSNDATAVAAVIDLYSYSLNPVAYSSGGSMSLSYLGGLSADELDIYSTISETEDFSTNNLTPINGTIRNSFWGFCYQQIYRANAIIEGVADAPLMSDALKRRMKGEALFFRAFAHFYLINLFGDAPLVLTTDYNKNARVTRTPAHEVYDQIEEDLKAAESLLPADYLAPDNQTAGSERTRVNKFAATAMLARVYLYRKNWVAAEEAATKVIGYTDLYSLEALDDVFLKTSREAIWQLSNGLRSTADAATFYLDPSLTIPPNGALKASFVHSFAAADVRRTHWVGTLSTTSGIYYFPFKYKEFYVFTNVSEYSMVLRLGEQYLIRAEARAQQGKLTGENSAASDLLEIRDRAGLGGVMATDRTSMLQYIEQERFFELFSEWGHRWLDLKRTDRANAVLGPIKGVNWQTTDQLYPIPQTELNANPAMADQQNPGYQ